MINKAEIHPICEWDDKFEMFEIFVDVVSAELANTEHFDICCDYVCMSLNRFKIAIETLRDAYRSNQPHVVCIYLESVTHSAFVECLETVCECMLEYTRVNSGVLEFVAMVRSSL